MPSEEEYEILREGEDTVLRINALSVDYLPSLEDDQVCFSKTLDKLMKNRGITKIVFVQKQRYEYDYRQVKYLSELASLIVRLTRRKDLFSYSSFRLKGATPQDIARKYTFFQNLIMNIMKRDPLLAYLELRRHLRKEKIIAERKTGEAYNLEEDYIKKISFVLSELEKLSLIKELKKELEFYKEGSRELYRKLFNPSVQPEFMYTKLVSAYPKKGEEIESYMVGDMEVTVFDIKDSVKKLYHILPPEFKIPEDQYELLQAARNILSEHKPEKEEFVEPKRVREVFYNIGKDLLQELAAYRNITLNEEELESLTQMLVRYTIGFGLIELIISDEKIQDLSINAPLGRTPLFLVHAEHGDCYTNIIPTREEAESWATKLRLISGRPLDESNNILDTELEFPGANTRVAAITYPLNPYGLAFSFRRHRDRPWTLPLFIHYKMINPLAAGLISFLIDGTRSFLIAGTRSSGKTSFLTSMLVEIMRKHRIITIEDTLELPTQSLRKLGFNIQPLKVASALGQKETEVSASVGIRTTLRLGDSALIVGEVRSEEAIALYEAMRVGAAANVVAGTIHGDSPYGVFDRVVNDIGVPKTSFKATDICIIANPIRSSSGLEKKRRITQITEVRKDWTNDPSLEHGFVDLLKYNPDTDELEPTKDLINGDSDIIKIIASSVPEWASNWDAVWDNILLRGKVKEAQTRAAEENSMPELLEAEFTVLANDMFHKISEKVKAKTGKLDSSEIFTEWKVWLDREVYKRTKEVKENLQ